ncbi:putative aminotransferase [Cladorrhinum samala]|uniref:Aminotransferase n=1 Tax=Cladorrhinum samala TaxID=585594 RepID=A0AAV9HGX0_9PEZI|nr:putative aminotransferase [Cladorrhinum samala]
MSTSNRKENIQSPPLKVSRLSSLQPRLLDDCLPPAAPPHPKSEDVDGGGGNNSKPAPSLINLLRGWPNPSLLAVEQLKRATGTVLEDKKVWIPGLEYAPDPGFVPLRGRIAEWTAKHYGQKTSADEICITGGASQSLANILLSFTDPGVTRAVWMAAPCYFLACPIFEDAGLGERMRAVPEDDEGVDVEVLRKLMREFEANGSEIEYKPTRNPYPHRKHYRHLIYLVPTFSNPSGKTMGLKSRRALVELAREFDALLVCDDVYDFLQWPVLDQVPAADAPVELPNEMLPRLSDIDISLGRSQHSTPEKNFGHAVSNGSFSKLAGPGVRTGWVHGTPDFVVGLSQTGATRSGGAPSQFSAIVMDEMLRNGDLDKHLSETVRPALQRRHALITKLIREELEAGYGCKLVEQENEGKEGGDAIKLFGGYFVWIKLPEGVKASEVAQAAKKEGNLIVAEGPLFEVAGDEDAAKFDGFLRLSFAWEEEEGLVEGVKRLSAVLKRVVAGEKPVKGLDGAAEDGNESEYK